MKKTIIGLSAFLFICGFAASGHALDNISIAGVDIHGFISQGYLKSDQYNYPISDAKKGSFQFDEVGINFSKQVTDKLRIGAQFFARDIGDAANNKITLDWAYGDYRWQDWLGLRAGKIKLSYGLYNETRDMDMLRTCIILPQSIYSDLLRDSLVAMNGAGLYGTIPMAKAGNLEYQLQAGVINADASSGTGKYLGSMFGGATIGDFSTDTIYAGSMRWNTPLEGLSLKGSFLRADADVPATFPGPVAITIQSQSFHQIYSLEYIKGDLTLVAEYKAQDNFTAGTSPRNVGYYGMASYRFTQWLEAGAHYSELYPDSSDKSGARYTAIGQPDYFAWQKDAALFLRFDINDNFVFKLEGHSVSGVADVLAVDNPIRDKKDWMYFGAKLTFSF